MRASQRRRACGSKCSRTTTRNDSDQKSAPPPPLLRPHHRAADSFFRDLGDLAGFPAARVQKRWLVHGAGISSGGIRLSQSGGSQEAAGAAVQMGHLDRRRHPRHRNSPWTHCGISADEADVARSPAPPDRKCAPASSVLDRKMRTTLWLAVLLLVAIGVTAAIARAVFT